MKMDEIEFIARALCKSNGTDPDQIGGSWDGGRLPKGNPAWTAWAGEVKFIINALDEFRKSRVDGVGNVG